MKTNDIETTKMINNINGLSVGDRAYCGSYGTVTCTRRSNGQDELVENRSGNFRGMTHSYARGSRRFSVSGCTNGKLANCGNWTMSGLRKAIAGQE